MFSGLFFGAFLLSQFSGPVASAGSSFERAVARVPFADALHTDSALPQVYSQVTLVAIPLFFVGSHALDFQQSIRLIEEPSGRVRHESMARVAFVTRW